MFSCCTTPAVAAEEVLAEAAPGEEATSDVRDHLPESSAAVPEEPMNALAPTSPTRKVPERDDKNWQVIFKDERANLKMEYLPSKFTPGGAFYRARAVMEMPLAVEDVLLCFMDFSKKKLKYARDYKDIEVEKIVKQTGRLPGGLPEESIVTVTLSFSGFLWIVKPFFPATITLRLVIEEDGEEYHWLQESLGADWQPDGRSRKSGSISTHPSDPRKCILSSLSEVPAWFPVWVMKYSAPKIKTYLADYIERYLQCKAGD